MKKTKKNKNKKSKRKFRIFLLILIFILIIAFAILLLDAYVFKSKIDTIVIHDNYYLQDEEIYKKQILKIILTFILLQVVNRKIFRTKWINKRSKSKEKTILWSTYLYNRI